MSLAERAEAFASIQHYAIGQKRKYTGADYIEHPAAVVAILQSVGITDEVTIAAAWLHDVVEDCPVSIEVIEEAFGADVAKIVADLTDSPTELANRAKRKLMDRIRLSQASAEAQTIKVADLIDNTGSIVERDPHFAKTYMREKELLLPMLTKADPTLLARATAILTTWQTDQLTAHLEAKPHA